MAKILALEYVFDAVVARFKDEGTHVPNVFGWREPGKQAEAPRICWIPGDPNGAAGVMAAAVEPGRNPAPLATFRELVTIEIFSTDPNNPEDERAQWRATRLLYDAWFRAVHKVARGTFKIASAGWLVDRRERQLGATMRVVLELEAMVPDVAHEVAGVDARARVVLSELDVDEETNTDEEEP